MGSWSDAKLRKTQRIAEKSRIIKEHKVIKDRSKKMT